MNSEKMGKFVALLRKEKGYTQDELAELIPVSRQAISKWELGKSTPDSFSLERLSKIFDVTVGELLSGERLSSENLSKLTLNMLDDNKSKGKKIKFLIGLLIFLIIFFLFYYFINSYNTIKVYTISATSDNININNGIFVITKEKIYFRLGTINVLNDVDIDNIALYYKDENNRETLIYSCNSECVSSDILLIDKYGYNVYFNYDTINTFIKNAELKIVYKDGKSEDLNINFIKDFSNNILIFKNDNKTGKSTVKNDYNTKNVIGVQNQEMINNIKQKFIKSDDGYSYKDKVIDAYFIDNLLILKYSKGKYILNWTINFEFNNIFFSKIDNDKKVYELKYDMNTKECLSDNCNDIEENYNEIISILNKIFDSN